MSVLRPMLAGKMDLSKIRYPVLMQPKFDGIRVLFRQGVAISRTLKPLPNKHFQLFAQFYGNHLEGLDGEVFVGRATDKDVYRNTCSGIMSEDGQPAFWVVIFDVWNQPEMKYPHRHMLAQAQWDNASPDVRGRSYIVPQVAVRTEEELIRAKMQFLELGYEGAIVRHPETTYKYGRSTTNEGALLKFKDFEDAEATIIGFDELFHNDNVAAQDNLGYTKRSSHLANKRAGDTLGALVVKSDLYTSEFRIGTGFDQALRAHIWQNREKYLGKTAKFRFLRIGMKDVPRHPSFLGFRDPIDM